MAFSFVLCADDYGMTAAVSRGILEAAVAGRISAASAMTSLPDWPRAASAWREVRPPADLGLHLTLTVGSPLGPMPLLAPGGGFPSLATFIRARDLPAVEIEAEIARQIDVFIMHAGHAPRHIDGHQHVHVLPAIRDLLLRVLDSRGLGSVRLRDSSDRPASILRRRTSVAKALTVAGLARRFAAQVVEAGFVCNRGFAGFSPFDPAADLANQFARYLLAPGHDHLVMCHPGYVDEALRKLDPVTEARVAELKFLLSDAWPETMAQAGARLRRQA